MTTTTPKSMTSQQKLILAGSVVAVVGTTIIFKRKISAAKVVAANTAVDSWIKQINAAGFEVFVLNNEQVKFVASATGSNLSTVA